MADDEACAVRLRLSGDDESITTLMGMVRASDQVDRVVETGADADETRDDSSSAGLAEATQAEFHNVEIHALNPDAAQQVRDLVEVAGRDLDVVVEYLDRF